MYNWLKDIARERKTILCFGIDPSIQRIRLEGSTEDRILLFYSGIVDTLLEENQIAAIKPNYAYFAQYGFDGLNALMSLIRRYKNRVPIILDGKRGDIDRSSEAYATEVYNFWNADAVTVSPYMGEDSIRPFLVQNKLAYLLCRTSNPGAKDFQELKAKGKPIYEHVALKALSLNCGLVVGATSTSIKRIVKLTKDKLPFLIPGVGTQGGDLKMVLQAIKNNISHHRINSSSSIAFAYEKTGGKPEQAALQTTRSLNAEISKFF
ncbi:orotidine-5'-phosphate decarboxylase [Candidatus Micrarchaeota archaeon]|nr:orotidine-5'-phosphate decarboxylase [Candidatus Micrarchaeota archaeon]